MNKEEFAEQIDVARKHIHSFDIETPKGHYVDGLICKSRGGHMGSLLINHVDGELTEQYVQGMPKISYLDSRYEPQIPTVRLKEDGTNILLYPLKNPDGKVLEVLMKTRLMPELSPAFYDKTYPALTQGMLEAVEKTKLSLAFELIGGNNIHEIQYHQFEEDYSKERLVALCAFDNTGQAWDSLAFEGLCYVYDLEPAMKVFNIRTTHKGFEAITTPEFEERHSPWLKNIPDLFENVSMGLLYKDMETFFEKININFQKQNEGKIIIEGAVWQIGSTLAKCKAISVREGHIKQACGIPTHDIRKALQKLKENTLQPLPEQPITDVISFVRGELSEEYPATMVNDVKTADKIKSTFGRFIRKVELTEEITQICSRINQEVGEDADTTTKLQTFAKLYPDSKKLSGKVYQALEAGE